jgi:hypothetical protein
MPCLLGYPEVGGGTVALEEDEGRPAPTRYGRIICDDNARGQTSYCDENANDGVIFLEKIFFS